MKPEGVQQRFFRFAEIVHLRLFGYPMGEGMRKFLGNLSWSFFGGVIASLAMLFVNVLGGRFMGPEQYGFYGLVLAVSQVLILLSLFGMDTAGLKLLSRDKTKEACSESMSTMTIFVGILTAIIFLPIFVFTPFLGDLFNVGETFFVVVIAYSVVMVVRSMTDIFFRGLYFFREQFFSRMVEIFLVGCLFFITFFFLKKASYESYIFVLCGGYMGFIFCGAWLFRRYFSKFRFDVLKKQISYAWVIILGSALGLAFNSLDKFIIAKYLNIEELGVYMAYFTASTNLVAQATQTFVNVYFPSVSRISDNNFVRKLDRLFLLGAVPVFLVLSSVIYVVMLLFGSQYGHNMKYIVSFGFLSTLQVALTIYWSTIMALSNNLYKKYVIIFSLINLVHLAGYGVLIYFESVSILAVVYMFIINVIVSIFFGRWLLGRAKF